MPPEHSDALNRILKAGFPVKGQNLVLDLLGRDTYFLECKNKDLVVVFRYRTEEDIEYSDEYLNEYDAEEYGVCRAMVLCPARHTGEQARLLAYVQGWIAALGEFLEHDFRYEPNHFLDLFEFFLRPTLLDQAEPASSVDFQDTCLELFRSEYAGLLKRLQHRRGPSPNLLERFNIEFGKVPPLEIGIYTLETVAGSVSEHDGGLAGALRLRNNQTMETREQIIHFPALYVQNQTRIFNAFRGWVAAIKKIIAEAGKHLYLEPDILVPRDFFPWKMFAAQNRSEAEFYNWNRNYLTSRMIFFCLYLELEDNFLFREWRAELEAMSRLIYFVLPVSDEDKLPDDETSPGVTSRQGGRPDLAPGMNWPEHEGHPLCFLAQLKLSELPTAPAPPVRELPEQGLLSFFAAPGNAREHEEVYGRVLYTARTENLERAKYPENLPESARLKSRNFNIQLTPVLPGQTLDNYTNLIEDEFFRKYFLSKVEGPLFQNYYRARTHRLSGYPTTLDHNTDEVEQPLFQFIPGEHDEEAAVLQFTIEPKDLKTLDFENVRTFVRPAGKDEVDEKYRINKPDETARYDTGARVEEAETEDERIPMMVNHATLWSAGIDPEESGLVRFIPESGVTPLEFLRLPIDQQLDKVKFRRTSQEVRLIVLQNVRDIPEEILRRVAIFAAREALVLERESPRKDRRHKILDQKERLLAGEISEQEWYDWLEAEDTGVIPTVFEAAQSDAATAAYESIASVIGLYEQNARDTVAGPFKDKAARHAAERAAEENASRRLFDKIYNHLCELFEGLEKAETSE